MPGSSLQCWVWLMCKDAGACDSALRGDEHKQQVLVSMHFTEHVPLITVVMTTTWQA